MLEFDVGLMPVGHSPLPAHPTQDAGIALEEEGAVETQPTILEVPQGIYMLDKPM